VTAARAQKLVIAAIQWGLAALIFLPASCSDFSGYRCAGSQLGCSRRKVEDCAAQPGCQVEIGCASVDCASLGTREQCEQFVACRWDPAIPFCWTGDACDALTEPACSSNASCVWGQMCGGQGVSCSKIETSEPCVEAGCNWERRPAT
jgi:hypothetical protein